MKLCPKCDPRAICCDHCVNYDFNADSEGRYTGAGWCRLHQRSEDPGSECDDYECFFSMKINGDAVDQRPVPGTCTRDCGSVCRYRIQRGFYSCRGKENIWSQIMGAFDGIRIPYDKGYPTTEFKREYEYFKTQPAFSFHKRFGMPDLVEALATAERNSNDTVWVPHEREGWGHIGLSTWYVRALIDEYR